MKCPNIFNTQIRAEGKTDSIDLDTLHDKDKGYLSLARLKKFEM